MIGRDPDQFDGERRWPMAVAVITAVDVRRLSLPGDHMALQSLISLAILGLVVARAVNILT